MNILKQIYKSDNFSQKYHLNRRNQYYLYIVHHFIHPNTDYVIMDENTSNATKQMQTAFQKTSSYVAGVKQKQSFSVSLCNLIMYCTTAGFCLSTGKL